MAAKRQTRAKITGGKPEKLAPDAQHQSATWVNGMRQHFQRTGYYRAEDLERLLGNPRESAESSSIPAMLFCASHAK
jgi:hypothetical protein